MAVIFLVLLVVGIAIYQGMELIEETFRPQYEILETIQPGMTEARVRELLGKPHKVYEAGTAPEDYYVEGWAYKRRPITNQVFIYHGGAPIL